MANDTENTDGSVVGRLPFPVRLTDQLWPEGIEPLVSIICLTYNHEKFITECLNGFIFQETTFPVEIIIHDDASTDSTKTIILDFYAKYPKLFKLVLQLENQFSKGVRPTPIAISKANGRYVAFCDGDDYWVYKRKLEEQVSLLENNLGANMCFHKVAIRNGVGNVSKDVYPLVNQAVFYPTELVIENIVPTSSVLVRKASVEKTPEWYLTLLMNDWPRWVVACDNSCALMIDKVYGVYRIHSSGLWTSACNEKQTMANLDFFYKMIEFGPACVRAAAEEKKKDVVLQLVKSLRVSEKIYGHVVFGPLIRFWSRYVNSSFPKSPQE